MSDEATRQLIMRVIAGYDPVKRAEHEALRDDPWRWYCRLCGAKGQDDSEANRDQQATHHLDSTRCGIHSRTGWEKAGRLLHVWTYMGGK